ncbi:MAG: YggS family pyridoxal phosphate-dependent enzyme [Streptococcaceae bacterium]|jgi:pyridoxal phosphate enzyme (YggS family)|nr:YggS family pyridoxal phosphate-dependent enzyme [Streptococcaceae bacterium]
MSLSKNISAVRARVENAAQLAGRNPEDVRILAVTKYSEAEIAREFAENGVLDLAENRVDKLLEKQAALSELTEIRWHLIGNLQTRKVKDIINHVAVFHALDSLKLAREIDKRAAHVVDCLLEVNISGEASKHGLMPDELTDTLFEALEQLTNVRIIGLMTMAPIDAENDELTEIFGRAHELQQRIASKKMHQIPCTELSMGMSQDFEVAIAQGATMVRIGREFLK